MLSVSIRAQYAATDVFLPPPFEPGETKMVYSKRASALLKEKLDIEMRGSKALDLVVDASGAEVCIEMGLLITRIGGTFVQVRSVELEAWPDLTWLP